MPVDEIASRQRLLEEQRARDIARLDERRKTELEQLQNERVREVKKIALDQQNEISQKKSDADFQIARAEESANNRIKEFEASTARLTDEATRQYKGKMELLNKNAKDMDDQRKHIAEAHNKTMKTIHQNHEQQEIADKLRLEKQANASYMNQLRNIQDIEQKGKTNAEITRHEMEALKRKEVTEGQRDIEKLQFERDMQRGVLARQIDFDKNSQAGQLNHLKANYEQNRGALQEQFENELSSLRRQDQGEINRTHIAGKRQVADTTQYYATQVDQTTKDATKKTKDIQTRATMTQSSLEEDAKTQEILSKRRYQFQKEAKELDRRKTIEEYDTKNAEMKEKLDGDYKLQADVLRKQKKSFLDDQLDQTKKDLSYQKNYGQKQIDAITLNNARTLASHSTKQADAFYQLHSIRPQVEESEFEVVVRVRVPEHEQSQVRLTEQNGSVTLSGTRKNETKVKTDEGRSISTHAYQTYTESIPIRGKLKMNNLVRGYDNGVLTFRIPKF